MVVHGVTTLEAENTEYNLEDIWQINLGYFVNWK